MNPPRPFSVPEPVFRELESQREAINVLASDMAEVRGDLIEVKGSVKDAVHEIKASNGTETRKLIGAIAVAMITTLGGMYGAIRASRPATRSESEIRLDVCRVMSAATRDECVARALGR